MQGSQIYVTASPCWICFKMIVNAGIRKITYGEFYREEKVIEWARRLGVELVHLPIAGLEFPLE